MPTDSAKLPVISLKPLLNEDGNSASTAASLAHACRESGFFYIVDHGIDLARFQYLELLSRQFFALPLDQKMRVARGAAISLSERN